MRHIQKEIIIITNIKIKGVSRCSKCLGFKSFVDKVIDKYEPETIVTLVKLLQFLLYWILQNKQC